MGSRGSDTFIKSLIFHTELSRPFALALTAAAKPSFFSSHEYTAPHMISKRVIFNLINVYWTPRTFKRADITPDGVAAAHNEML